MKIDDEAASQIMADVHRICHSSRGWSKSDVEEVEDHVLAVVVCRLSGVNELQKPLKHFVRCTAAREATKEFKRLARLRNLSKSLTALNDIATARDDHSSLCADVKRLVKHLPVDVRSAVEEFFGFREKPNHFESYYRKNLGVEMIRSQMKAEGNL